VRTASAMRATAFGVAARRCARVHVGRRRATAAQTRLQPCPDRTCPPATPAQGAGLSPATPRRRRYRAPTHVSVPDLCRFSVLALAATCDQERHGGDEES